MLSQYRALLARGRARPLVLACALGWIAFTSYALAIILAVHAATGSFSVAGGAVAAFSAGSGLAAPARGRFIDTHGARSLGVFAVTHGVTAAGLVAACALHASTWILMVTAALAGALAPPLIATARMLWADVAGPALTKPAHAPNASLADVAQLLSPGVVAGLAGLVAPSLALAVLTTGAAVAGVLIAVVGRHSPPKRRSPSRGLWGVVTESSGLRTLIACDVAGGLWTGGLEVALTSLASRHGGAELAAIPLAAAALGGILASLWVGSRSVSAPAASRYVGGSIAVAVVVPLAVIEPSLATVTGIAVLAGAGYGILGAALFELLDHLVPGDRAVEAFTWLTTGQAAGTAAGAAAAGALAQRATSDAFAPAAIAAEADRRIKQFHQGGEIAARISATSVKG
jgi:MFS transporter